MHKKGKINKKQNKGITLIALVITIIVLLILAGVTINTLFDNGNAIDKAAEARDETNKGNIKEQLDLAVITSRINDNNANINTDKLKSELEKLKNTGIIESYKPSESDFQLPCTVKKDDYEFTIDEDGNVTAKSENAKKAEKVNKAIGQTVSYGDDITDYNGGWRVFYASEDEMFLISADVIATEIAFEGTKGIPLAPKGKYSAAESGSDYSYPNEDDKYKSSEDVFIKRNPEGSSYTYKDVTYGAKYNSKWKTKLEEAKTQDIENRSKATAYLCDPKNWEKYISRSAPEGTYAVGGPTKELLVLSWNQAKESGLDTAPTTTVTWDDNVDVVAEGYLYNKPTALYSKNAPYPINKDILNGLYNTEVNYWLASPSSYNSDRMCSVGDGFVGLNNYYYYNGVRPIVSIPISNVQILEDGTVTIK